MGMIAWCGKESNLRVKRQKNMNSIITTLLNVWPLQMLCYFNALVGNYLVVWRLKEGRPLTMQGESICLWFLLSQWYNYSYSFELAQCNLITVYKWVYYTESQARVDTHAGIFHRVAYAVYGSKNHFNVSWFWFNSIITWERK